MTYSIQTLLKHDSGSTTSANKFDTLPPFTSPRLVQLLSAPEQLALLDIKEWDTLIRIARKGNVLGKLASTLIEANLVDTIPEKPRSHIIAAYALSTRQAQAMNWEVRCLSTALAEIGLPVVLLKGAAYLASNYPFARGRMFSDVDILVPRQKIREVEAVLAQHGWASIHHSKYDDRYYRQWMHELPPMRHLRRGTVVDVHHRILPLTARFDPDPATMLARSVPVGDIEGARTLCPADMLLHSATHLFHEGELPNGFRDLLDLDGLFHQFSNDPGFAETLVERAKALHLEEPLWFAVHQCRTQLGTPAALMPKLPQRSGIRQQMMDWLYRRALHPFHPLLDLNGSSFARWALYVRSHWLRMPPHLLAYHLGRKALMRFESAPPPGETKA